MLSPLIRISLALLAWILLGIAATPALAAQFKAASLGGLMTQPTSHYYHAVYGIQVDAGTASERFWARLSYIERPEFQSQGFADKDYGAFAQIGTKVTKTKNHGVYAFIGGGQMAGYIIDQSASNAAGQRRRAYSMSGLTASAEYAVNMHGLDAAIGHQTFVGFADDVQTRAFVAWPFNFFTVSVGYRW